jgi:hypothetical protein
MAKRVWNDEKDKKLQAAEQRLRKLRSNLQRLKRTKVKSDRQIRAERLHTLGALVDAEAKNDQQLLQRLRDLVKRNAGPHAEAFSGTPYAAEVGEKSAEQKPDPASRPVLSLKGAGE